MIGEADLIDPGSTRSIIGAFFDAYNEIGFGFLESVCVAALCEELERRGHVVAREVGIEVHYKNKIIAWQRIDLLVDGRIVVEVKAGDAIPSSARLQLSNYLRATGLEVGLLLHFGLKPRVTRLYIPNKKKSD